VRDVLRFEQAPASAPSTTGSRPATPCATCRACRDGTAGTAQGVRERRRLLVHTAAGLQAVTSSEVSVRPA
jgi:hypothetical protein